MGDVFCLFDAAVNVGKYTSRTLVPPSGCKVLHFKSGEPFLCETESPSWCLELLLFSAEAASVCDAVVPVHVGSSSRTLNVVTHDEQHQQQQNELNVPLRDGQDKVGGLASANPTKSEVFVFKRKYNGQHSPPPR